MKKEAKSPVIAPICQMEIEDAPVATVTTLDDYGFDQSERTLLAEEGWDLMLVDELLEMDFSPSDIVKLARLKVSPSEASYLLSHGYTVDDVMALINDSKVEERI